MLDIPNIFCNIIDGKEFVVMNANTQELENLFREIAVILSTSVEAVKAFFADAEKVSDEELVKLKNKRRKRHVRDHTA
ncbi:MAG: hypothetical protein WC631_01425 [Candidatus Paceibacterota bacterium]